MTEQRKFVTTAPENSETPLDEVRSWVTPNRLFFVRNHFDVPNIDVSTYRLSLEGCVEKPREWTWEELLALPERTVFATVECAGNGRSFLQPAVGGVQWGAGAIGHAEWTGVPVKLLLEQAGVQPDAVEVVFEGCDRGTEPDHPEPMTFSRGLPLEKALHPDTLLAYRMNGELLEPSHGFPLRLFVPGWYGVASIKWVTSIRVLNRVYDGYFQTKKYTIERRVGKETKAVPLGPIAVKSEMIRPSPGDVLGIGTNRLFGVAWAGEQAVAAVEVSVDCGKTWTAATFLGPTAPYSWTMWEYLWEVAEPGDYELLVRAKAADGTVQPMEHDTHNGGYLIHHCRPVGVRIESARTSRALPSDAETILYDMNAYAEENTRRALDVEMEFSIGGGI